MLTNMADLQYHLRKCHVKGEEPPSLKTVRSAGRTHPDTDWSIRIWDFMVNDQPATQGILHGQSGDHSVVSVNSWWGI